MKILLLIFGLFLNAALFAGDYESLFDKNQKALQQCQQFFEKKDGITTIYLLNKRTMRLPDLYTKNNSDDPYLVSSIVDCFYKENLLVQADLVVEDRYYFLINLENGSKVNIDGMTYLSPDRKHFMTSYSAANDHCRFSIYHLKQGKSKKLFNYECHDFDSYAENIKWINKNKVTFDLVSGDNLSTKIHCAIVQQKNKKWKFMSE